MAVLLSLFGVPSIALDGAVHPLPFERRTQLLAHLAFRRSWVGRDELAALLWPEQDTRLAQTNLRKALFRLQGLPGADRLDTQGRALRVLLPTDVQAFEEALREQRIADALALRRGELLAGFDDVANDAWTAWLGFERERLRSAWRGAVQQHLRGEPPAAEAVALAQRLLDDDPLDEGAVRLYMDGLLRAGQPAQARQAGRAFAARLRDELGVEPSAELRALNEALAAAPANLALPLAGSDASAVQSFIGRTVELRRIAALLAQDDCRLLCLTGPGGIGKTSLARRALHDGAAHFADGAAFVALEELSSAQEIGARLAQAIDLTLKGRADPMQQVTEALRPRQMLLALDNFEHLADGARQLEPLLAACPRVKLLVTSRVRLALPGEWLLPLDGLPCPDDEDRDHIESFDSVRLFVRAARRVQPDLDPLAEAAAIVEICRQVDGLPLALELAAAWTRVLPCAAIAAELRSGAELLQASDAAQPARHASIERVFEQSWRLLGGRERDALLRLAVFQGGFTHEAARAVAQAPLAVLGALADKSLLRRDGERMHLHPLLQQWAARKLQASAAGPATEAAHANYFYQLQARLDPKAERVDPDVLRLLDREFENYLRAWRWASVQGQARTLERSSRVLTDYFDFRGRAAEGLARLNEAIQAPVARADAALRALLLSRAAHLEYRLDRYDEAIAHAEAALGAAGSGDAGHATRLQALDVLGGCALRQARFEDARRHYERVLREAEPGALARTRANTLDHLALIERQTGRREEALRLSSLALAEYRRLGDRPNEALCLSNLALVLTDMGEYEAAIARLRDALGLCERDGLVSTQMLVLNNLADVLLRVGDPTEAAALAEQAAALANAAGNRMNAAVAELNLAWAQAQRADLPAARAALERGLQAVSVLGGTLLKLGALDALARVLVAEGAADCARQVLQFALANSAALAAANRHLQARLAEHADGPARAWPADLQLDDLLAQAAAGTATGYAALIARLRAMPPAEEGRAPA
jgi:predicted ATPase/DNA-binding SARP family transcriptional activator